MLTWFDALPEHVARSVGDRRLVVHQMHSVNDSMGFGVWHNGRWVRRLGMDPDNGIFLNEGEPLPAERPFWAGEHAEDDDYSLPFHPLELAEELLRAELGFVLEGEPGADDVDPFEIPMFTFARQPQPTRRRRLFPPPQDRGDSGPSEAVSRRLRPMGVLRRKREATKRPRTLRVETSLLAAVPAVEDPGSGAELGRDVDNGLAVGDQALRQLDPDAAGGLRRPRPGSSSAWPA